MRRSLTMQRVRRLGSLALVVALGTIGLSGCRSAPTMAAYVGDGQYTQKRIDEMTDEVRDAIESLSPADRATVNLGPLRQTLLVTVVMGDVAMKVADERGVNVPAADMTVVTDMLGIPEGSQLARAIVKTDFAKALAETQTAMAALLAATPSIQPSESDQREVHKNLMTYQGVPVTDSFDDIRRGLGKDDIGHEIALRRWLQAGVERYDVTVNPRYAPIEWQIPVRVNSTVSAFVAIPLVTR